MSLPPPLPPLFPITFPSPVPEAPWQGLNPERRCIHISSFGRIYSRLLSVLVGSLRCLLCLVFVCGFQSNTFINSCPLRRKRAFLISRHHPSFLGEIRCVCGEARSPVPPLFSFFLFRFFFPVDFPSSFCSPRVHYARHCRAFIYICLRDYLDAAINTGHYCFFPSYRARSSFAVRDVTEGMTNKEAYMLTEQRRGRDRKDIQKNWTE